MANDKEFSVRDGELKYYFGPGGEVVIPEGIVSVDFNAFAYCSSGITSITIPSTLTGMREGRNLKDLENIILSPDNGQYRLVNRCLVYTSSFAWAEDTVLALGCKGSIVPEEVTVIEKNAMRARVGEGRYTIPESVRNIRKEAFAYGKMSALSILGATCIEENAFSWCSELKWLEIAPSASIEEYAFNDCAELERAVVPPNIAVGAFDGCKSLRVVIVEVAESAQPDAVPVCRIHRDAFSGCENLERIELSRPELFRALPINLKPFAMLGFVCRYAEKRIAEGEEKIYASYIKRNRKVIVNEKYDCLPLYIYMTDRRLLSAEDIDGVLENVSSVETKALLMEYKNRIMTPEMRRKAERDREREWEKLFSDAPKTLAEYKAEWSFARLPDGTYKLTAYKGPENHVRIPEEICGVKVTAIGASAFSPTVTRYGTAVVKSRKAIESVIIPEGVTEIGHSAFFGCSSLKKAELPSSLKSIGRQAFAGCSSLEAPKLGEGIAEIGSFAFCGCVAITEITIPDGVTELDHTFSRCRSLKKLIIPKSVVKIVLPYDPCNEPIIYVFRGSYAEKYVLNKKIRIRYIDQ